MGISSKRKSTNALTAALFAATACISTPAATDVYLEPSRFLAQSFEDRIPDANRLWVTKPIGAKIRNIMGHDLGLLRIRYWRRGERTAWILEEIGKEQPITTGFVVDGGKLTDVHILIYRESRGWEVRHPAFTDQFRGAALSDHFLLDRRIDGITGATMSVDAVIRLARLALLLHQHTDP
ncbi:MAG TPA: FMN-binding protein [Gammaproteobacteria bacterium]|nr:FMN-binding protein [Gammaproteobacteria bacterium]